ncbi:endonuclease [Candidatus Woesearchaeota archaeon]|nr:endonuclease [Candidatus Woesearchaeota archaeon]
MEILTIVLAGIILGLFLVLWLKNKELNILKELHKELRFSHKSNAVKHGQSFEQLFPFMSSYPFDSNNFRFIGSPIDGISFEEDSIVFVEFKTGSSQLSKKQRKIRDLINSKQVEWKEIREK